jgi:hypothetical protein
VFWRQIVFTREVRNRSGNFEDPNNRLLMEESISMYGLPVIRQLARRLDVTGVTASGSYARRN